MTDDPADEEPRDHKAEPAWQRRRRLAEVFGDVLPDTTADERDASDAPDGSAGRGDAWLREQVPPHHGG